MEEDIEILEEMKNALWEYFEDFKIDKDTSSTMKKIYEIRKAQVQAIENLINRVKELEEEKQQVLDDYQDLGKDLAYNFIPKSKIREKIEELEEENNETYTKFLESDRGNETLSTKGKMLQGAIQVLQELLGEEVNGKM